MSLTNEEIIRRLTVLHKMKRKKRPFSFVRLAELTGLRSDNITAVVVKQRVELSPKYRNLLEHALLQVEREAKQKMATRVRMTPTGPVLEFVPINPNALPVLPPINKGA